MSGLWMTLFYIAIAFDGPFVSAMRLAAGSAMALSLCLGVGFIRKGNILQHQAWMLRAYALGIGAGTQVVTHLPWFLFPGIQGELARTLSMGAGWAVNIAVAELLISRTLRGQVS